MSSTHTPSTSAEPVYSRARNIRTLPVTATWDHNRDQDPAPSPDTPPPRRPLPNVGKRTELGRYNTDAGERVLYAQRIDGVVRVTDRPAGTATETDRAYVVERDLTKKDELDALIADYLAEAERLHAIPMSLSPLKERSALGGFAGS